MPVETKIAPPKSLGHGKIMPPNTTDRDVIYMYLIHMAEKLGFRLRQHSLAARKFFIGLRTRDGWIGGNKLKTVFPTNDSRPIIELCHRVLQEYWRGEGVFQVQVTALDPRPAKGQTELFGEEEDRFHRLNKVMDEVNNRYGEFTPDPGHADATFRHAQRDRPGLEALRAQADHRADNGAAENRDKNMTMTFINAAAVRELLPMDECIDIMEPRDDCRDQRNNIHASPVGLTTY